MVVITLDRRLLGALGRMPAVVTVAVLDHPEFPYGLTASTLYQYGVEAWTALSTYVTWPTPA